MAGGVPIARFEGLGQGFEDFEARLFEGPTGCGGGGGGAFEGVSENVEFRPAGRGHFEDDESTVCFARLASCR